jgi:beta-lactam-binding protein with PASTA domain
VGRMLGVLGWVPALVLGTALAVSVSVGKPLVRVPELNGLSKSQASTRLAASGLRQGPTTPRHPGQGGLGTEEVDGQSPAPGSWALRGSVVDVTTQLGSTTGQVPNVIGLFEDDAKSALSAAGFRSALAAGSGEQTSHVQLEVDQSVVVSQTPAPGTDQPAATTVTVATRFAHPPTPTLGISDLELFHGIIYLRYGTGSANQCQKCHSNGTCSGPGCHSGKPFAVLANPQK